MTKVNFYCPKCGETTKQLIDYLAPGKDNFICDNCFTVWDIDIKFYDISPQKVKNKHTVMKYIKNLWGRK